MTDTLELEIENVGGLRGRHSFKLRPGLNVVKAPNAVGKTSFTKALELLILSDDEIAGKGHYANLFAPAEEPVNVKISGPVSGSRRFRRIGVEDLRAVDGEPLLVGEKRGAVDICFAVPENELINSLLSGKPIRDYLVRLSDSEHYDQAISILEELENDVKTRLAIYRDDVVRLEEAQRTLQQLHNEKEKLEHEFSREPLVDEKEVFKDYGEYRKKQAEIANVEEDLGRNSAALANVEATIEDYQSQIEHLQAEIADIKKKHPKINARLSQIARDMPQTEIDLKNIEKEQIKADSKLKACTGGIMWLKTHPEETICHTCGRPLTLQQLKKWERKIRRQLDDLHQMYKETSRKLEDLKDEQDILKRELEDLGRYENELKQAQETLARREKDKFTLGRLVQRLKERYDKIKAEIKKLSKSEKEYERYHKREELRFKISEKERLIEQIQSRIDELKSKTINLEEIETKRAFLEEAIRYLKTRKEEIVDAVRNSFNKKITDLYRKMGFRDFESIEITPDYSIHIYRKSKGVEVEDFPLGALAASERVTLGVALLIASKQEYLPEFPFFVLDELITSYDPTRFKKILDYIKGITDYVVVTELSGEELAGLKIEYKS